MLGKSICTITQVLTLNVRSTADQSDATVPLNVDLAYLLVDQKLFSWNSPSLALDHQHPRLKKLINENDKSLLQFYSCFNLT